MALLNVLRFPDERLRTVAKPVVQVDDAIRAQIDDMFETMHEENGVGLAATQVDFHQRLVVIDVSDDKSEPLVLINPEIIDRRGSMMNDEGCLSVPGTYAAVERAEEITFKALDRDGNEYQMEADGLLAICVQHELDHLMGKLFVDYLSPLKRDRIRKKLEKEAKAQARHVAN
ncbi:peptide deformylase [Echinimonas agarilytica]|uniref:Peptide deformylase n=1 Tax=Echinimonas agarilytica TaxID=1215918 RepID=A0AA41W3P4_9GAMM|nr:peptide deformylase [Echinimonas agarilytica]MCM2678063.1 peptide deformylase [Echinimonas agarilytica]